MRRYWRLALILAAVLSCTFMLVYRQKYYNLNSVLELMNIFKGSTVKNSSVLHTFSNDSTLHYDSNLLIEDSLNSNHWNEIFHGVYVYSSHFISKRVVSLGFANVLVRDMEDVTCRLWYENGTDSVKSIFKFYVLMKQATTVFYTTCMPSFDLGIPYAVTFIKRNFSSSVPVSYKVSHTYSYTACVKPLSSIFLDTNKILEFIVYHSHIGIKHFILYYKVMSFSLKKMLINIAAECGIYVELLPWNTPPGFEHGRLQLEPHMINCIFHMATLNHSNFVFHLDLDNFVSLGHQLSFKELIYNNSQFDFFKLNEKMFCSEFPNNIFAKNLNINFKTLLNTKVSTEMSEPMNVIYDVNRIKLNMEKNDGFKMWLLIKKVQKFNVIKESSAVIFSYGACGIDLQTKNSTVSFTENDKMWKFKNAFYKSCVYLLSKKAVVILD